MKKIILILLSNFLIKNIAYCQVEILPSIKNLQGIWKVSDGSYSDGYMVVKNNKSILINYKKESKTSSIYGAPFSYFGFWNSVVRIDEPKNISQLEKEGNQIFFYDFVGIDYDKNGNILRDGRFYSISINEDSEDPIPKFLRFYRNSMPDIYEKVKSIPNSVLLSLYQNKKDWKKYVDFMGIIQKPIISSKAILYAEINKPTKMYLLKGDEVEVLQIKNSWVKIRYYGKTTIEGWIKTSDLN